MSTPARDNRTPSTSPASPPPAEVDDAHGAATGFGESLKAKAPVVAKELLLPFITITTLFFLWGVANDLTNPMVSAFKKVMPELSNTQATMVQMAFYGGYGTMAIPAALFIRHFSYKSGILVGLGLYAAGGLPLLPGGHAAGVRFLPGEPVRAHLRIGFPRDDGQPAHPLTRR